MATNASGFRQCERAEPRMPILLAAELRTETGRAAARLTNLSRTGACVELDQPLLPGREVTLLSGALATDAQVVWRGESGRASGRGRGGVSGGGG